MEEIQYVFDTLKANGVNIVSSYGEEEEAGKHIVEADIPMDETLFQYMLETTYSIQSGKNSIAEMLLYSCMAPRSFHLGQTLIPSSEFPSSR